MVSVKFTELVCRCLGEVRLLSSLFLQSVRLSSFQIRHNRWHPVGDMQQKLSAGLSKKTRKEIDFGRHT